MRALPLPSIRQAREPMRAAHKVHQEPSAGPVAALDRARDECPCTHKPPLACFDSGAAAGAHPGEEALEPLQEQQRERVRRRQGRALPQSHAGCRSLCGFSLQRVQRQHAQRQALQQFVLVLQAVRLVSVLLGWCCRPCTIAKECAHSGDCVCKLLQADKLVGDRLQSWRFCCLLVLLRLAVVTVCMLNAVQLSAVVQKAQVIEKTCSWRARSSSRSMCARQRASASVRQDTKCCSACSIAQPRQRTSEHT